MRRITLLLLFVLAASVGAEPVPNYLKKTGTTLTAKTGLKLVADSAKAIDTTATGLTTYVNNALAGNVIENGFGYGDFGVSGNLWQINRASDIDIDRTYMDYPDTTVALPWPDRSGTACDDVGSPSYDSNQVHPSVLYFPKGKFGYRWWMAFTASSQCTNDSCPDEYIWMVVSNNGTCDTCWHPFIDSFSVSPTYDTMNSPILKPEDMPAAVADTVGVTADVELILIS